ncbi:MAG: FAD:protein FMN transferase [Pseudomonadota bacterium]
MTKYFIRVLLIFFLLPSSLLAEEYNTEMKLYPKQFKLDEGIAVGIIIMDQKHQDSKITPIMEKLELEAREIFAPLDERNLTSDIIRFNSTDKPKAFSSTPFFAAIIDSAVIIAKDTRGEVNLFEPNNTKSYKKVRVNLNKSLINVGDSNIKVNIKPIVPGFIADMLIKRIEALGIQNALVKVSNSYKAIGTSNNGPWKIQIHDPVGAFTNRAIYVSIKDAGLTTINFKLFKEYLIDSSPPSDDLSTVTVIAKNSATSATFAFAAFKMGMNGAKIMLEKFGYKGIISSKQGNFIRTNGF